MTMLMCMPSKNVYVSDADLPLFEAATTLAGSLSGSGSTWLSMRTSEKGMT